MYTTLNAIREHHPCEDLWETLLKYLGKTSADDEPLSLLTILESNELDDTLWCFRAVDGFEKEKLLLGIGFAKEVEHLMPDESKKALDVFDRYANGLATEEEFDAARAVADAACPAYASAADAAYFASYASANAAADAAVYAARAAAWAASLAAYDADARDAARDAAHAARSTTTAKQETQLRQLLERTT